MAELVKHITRQSRKCYVRQLVLFLSSLAIFLLYGCGGGSGGGSGGSAIGGASISGVIAAEQNLSGSQQALRNAATQPANRAKVWLESRPDINTETDLSGIFLLENVPAGNHRIISSIQNVSGQVFKNRSDVVSVKEGQQNTDAGTIKLEQATNIVTGYLKSQTGIPIADATLKLWGERFTTDSRGFFSTPPLPDNIYEATLEIEKATGFNLLSWQCYFQKNLIPELDLKLTELSQSLVSPVVQLWFSKSTVTAGDHLELIAHINAGENASDLQFSWKADHGVLAPSADKLKAQWTAPSYDVSTTIILTVTNSHGLSGSARISFAVGLGGPGLKPPVAKDLTLIAKAASASILLNWNELEAVDRYNLYWSNSPIVKRSQATKIADVKSPFCHCPLADASTYYYLLTAENGAGESENSMTASAATDMSRPLLLTGKPISGSVNIGFIASITMTFNKSMTSGNGFIKIFNSSGNLHESILPNSRNVKYNDKTVVIKLNNALLPNTEYYVILSDGALQDTLGNNFAGINDENAWRWTTESLWNLKQIEAQEAWSSSTGAGIIVAVLDTGIDMTHPEFAGQIHGEPVDLINDGKFMADDSGHGTHVSGVIAAKADNGGITGVAHGARILPVKVFNRSGNTTIEIVVEGMYAAADKGAKIINMSMGKHSYNQVLEDAVADLYSRGVLVFAAAGNLGSNIISYPAAYPFAVAVGATDRNEKLATFSNYGDLLSFSAPGDEVLSTFPVTATNPSGAGVLSGTSMATPHAAAVAALVWAKHPSWTPGQVINAMISGVRDLGEAGKDKYFGHGQVNALQSLQYVPAEGAMSSRLSLQSPPALHKSRLEARQFTTGHLLVKVIDGSSLSEILASKKLPTGSFTIKRHRMAQLCTLYVPAGQEIETAKILQSDDRVIYAELNEIISLKNSGGN